FEQWENRTGASFGMRADCRGRRPQGETAAFWPGMFVLFRSETSRNIESDYAQLSIRAGANGQDVRSVEIKEPGWWTLGMSFTPDGQIHYYASEGVDDLTADDYLASNYAYRYQALAFCNFFFNVANWDNGQSWSTPWVIDDPMVFVRPPVGQSMASLPRRKGQRVPTFPITHVHEADKPKRSGGLFGGLFSSSGSGSGSSKSARTASGRGGPRRR
ncbi:MAG: hypothetical protein AAF805_09760, partial [Planctomycetota bacterium]